MVTKKKTVAPTEETVATKTEAKVEAPKSEVKEWTYDELVVLPRDEYLKVEADIRSGKAKAKQQ